MFNQPLFARNFTAISTKITITINDTVTWNDNSELISAIGICNRAVSCGLAHLWQRQLKSGKYQTMQDLCDANKVTAKYVQLILWLNFLAPKLKETILLGHQPRHMKLADLMQNIPSLWHEQGELFGCELI